MHAESHIMAALIEGSSCPAAPSLVIDIRMTSKFAQLTLNAKRIFFRHHVSQHLTVCLHSLQLYGQQKCMSQANAEAQEYSVQCTVVK